MDRYHYYVGRFVHNGPFPECERDRITRLAFPKVTKPIEYADVLEFVNFLGYAEDDLIDRLQIRLKRGYLELEQPFHGVDAFDFVARLAEKEGLEVVYGSGMIFIDAYECIDKWKCTPKLRASLEERWQEKSISLNEAKKRLA